MFIEPLGSQLDIVSSYKLATMPTHKAISLFSGCGGLDIGATMAGAEVVFAVDSMASAVETLRTHMPNSDVVHSSIENVQTFPDADLVLGGYPCQSFSMGGRRSPSTDKRSDLYKEYARCLETVQPKFFIAENVIGLRSLASGQYLQEQIDAFENCGQHGYNVSYEVLNAADYGVPQRRKRLFIVGVRKDLGSKFHFPNPTHGRASNLLPYASHGDAIAGLPLWPEGEFYERPGGPDDTFPWYYMSRNRKAAWDDAAYTVVANWRHVTLHPASPTMKLTWSNLADGYKQRWDFSDEYEHLESNPDHPVLEHPRRLSWRECAIIQSFPDDFEPVGSIQSKFTQIGNAVPPRLAQAVVGHLLSGKGLVQLEQTIIHSI